MYVLKSPAWALLWPSRITHPYQLLDWVLNPVSNLKSFNQKNVILNHIFIYINMNIWIYLYILCSAYLFTITPPVWERATQQSPGRPHTNCPHVCQLYTNDTSTFSFRQNTNTNTLDILLLSYRYSCIWFWICLQSFLQQNCYINMNNALGITGGPMTCMPCSCKFQCIKADMPLQI